MREKKNNKNEKKNPDLSNKKILFSKCNFPVNSEDVFALICKLECDRIDWKQKEETKTTNDAPCEHE